jgi:iron complex transport system permease protein
MLEKACKRMKDSATSWAWRLVALSALVLLLGVLTGSQGLSTWSMLRDDPALADVVLNLRLPRTLGAWLAGALLGLAGAIAQGVFRNPLADPYLLGSASGASLGVALVLGLMGAWAAPWLHDAGLSAWLRLGLTGAAFVGAWLAVLLTLSLARGVQQTVRLLLAGVVVGVVLGALASLAMQWSPEAWPVLQSFMLGQTAMVDWTACALMAGVCVACALAAWGLSPLLDGLALGESTALSLGLRVVPGRMALVAVLALATATSVAQTGLIAFVGLAAPHLVRARVSVGHARFVGLSMLAGGVLLCAADVLARGLLAPRELPVGVVTAIVGGIYLLRLMRQPLHARHS